MSGKAFKINSVVLIIMAQNNFILLLKSFIANVLKCKGRLTINYKCMCVTMCSLGMSLFSRDYIKIEID